MYRVKTYIIDYQQLHGYYTSLKDDNNLIVPLNRTHFGNQSPVTKGVLFLRKYNIHIFILLIMFNLKIM